MLDLVLLLRFIYFLMSGRFHHLMVCENILRGSGCVKKRVTFSLAAILDAGLCSCHSKQCETCDLMPFINNHLLSSINMLLWVYDVNIDLITN